MTEKKPEKPQMINDIVDKMFNQLNKDLMDKRITDIDHYDLAIKTLIYKELARIADILEVMSKGK